MGILVDTTMQNASKIIGKLEYIRDIFVFQSKNAEACHIDEAITALRAADLLAFELNAVVPHLWYEGSSEKAALEAWANATK